LGAVLGDGCSEKMRLTTAVLRFGLEQRF